VAAAKGVELLIAGHQRNRSRVGLVQHRQTSGRMLLIGACDRGEHSVPGPGMFL
jgi:hypothetical protein